MKTRKEVIIYTLLCLAITFLQAASNAFQHLGKTLLVSSLLYFAFGLIVQKRFQGIKTWQVFAATIPYFLLIFSLNFVKEDIPVIIGVVTGLGLAILVYRSKLAVFSKVLLSVFWLTSLVYFAYWQIPKREITNRSYAFNKQLPAFTLLDSAARTISTDTWRGKVVLIDMWYTKCGACVKQLRATQKIEQHFKADPNVMICAVDCGYDSLKAIEAFKVRFPFLGQYYIDQDSSIGKHLKFDEFPRTLIIDKQGKLRLHVEGFSKEWEEEYQEKVISTIEQLARE